MAIKSKLTVAAIVFIVIALLQGIRMLSQRAQDGPPPSGAGLIKPLR